MEPLPEVNRVFAALDPDDDLRAVLAEAGLRAATALPGARAVPAENLHLTLAFLGPVPPATAPALADALALAVAAAPGAGLGVRLLGLRARPTTRRARLVAAEIADPEGALAALARRVGTGLAGALARPRPGVGFWPHVTLARVRRTGVAVVEGLSVERERVFDFRRAALYDSQTTPGRPPRYRVLVQFPIGRG